MIITTLSRMGAAAACMNWCSEFRMPPWRAVSDMNSR
jgi:hypothetical protein